MESSNGPQGQRSARISQVQEEAQPVLQQPWGSEQVVSLAWSATGQQAGLTQECGRVSLCLLSCPRVYTGTAGLQGQPSVSQESFRPRERQQFAFMESKLKEMAGTAQGNNPFAV